MFCLLKGQDHVFEFVNEAHIRTLGFDATGMAVRKAQPESVEVHGILDNVFKTGITANLHEIPVTLGKAIRYFDLTYAARKDKLGNVDGIMILGSEVTNKVLADKKVELERKRLYNFFEQVPSPIAVITGDDLVFELANHSYRSLFGPGREIVGMPLKKAIPDLGDELHTIIQKVISEGKSYIGEEFPLHIQWGNSKKRELKYFNFIYEPFTDINGVTNGIIAFVYEVTSHVLARKKILETESKLELALESGQMGLWHVNLVSNKVTTTDSLNKIMGVDKTPETLDFSTVFPDDRSEIERAFRIAIERREPFTKEFRVISSSGEIRWLSSSGKATYDEVGKPLSISGVSLDITSLKTIETRLKDAIKSKDDFLSIASHELKTPLTSMKLYVQTAQRKIDRGMDVSLNEFLVRNNAQVDRLIRLVDDMLDISRVQLGKLSFSLKSHNLSGFLS